MTPELKLNQYRRPRCFSLPSSSNKSDVNAETISHYRIVEKLGGAGDCRPCLLNNRFGAPGGIDVSPDGQWVLYARADLIENDIMMVENFSLMVIRPRSWHLKE
jgi:hypothetical protein